ncbi:MAG: tryptophan-rich sensory protein [Alphaproteobacteria bacterium]|nr:tryptophan-rich sensory protein [Alphaproteobacteria bacterium]
MFFSRDDSPADRPLLIFVLIALLVGGAATFFTEPSIAGWYAALNKPSFNPPNWVFAPVWTTLYILMGVAASRVWKEAGFGIGIQAWAAQLALNFLWSAIFFSLHLILWALVDLAALWLAILATLILFWRRDRIAGLLLVPYLAWVSFAFALNLAIWQLNGS